MNRKNRPYFLLAAIGLILLGCNKQQGSAPQSQQGTAPKMDMTAFALSIATPLSEEDKAVDVTAKSNNPNKIIWRHGVVVRNWDESPMERAERQFFYEMKKRLGDKVEFQVYTGGSLGTTADQILGGLQARSFESYSYNVGAFAEYTNAFLPLDVMYLIPNLEAGIKVCAGEPGELMRQKCIEDTGLNVIFYSSIGMRHITNTKRPIHTPKDMQGLKIRVQNNPLHIMAMTNLGAAPTPIAYAELFTALQQKVVDGQENPVSNIFDQNYGEVQTYMTLTNHMYTAGALVLNNSWILEQSPEIQRAIKESVDIATVYTAGETIKVENRLLKELEKQMEIISLTSEEQKVFHDLSVTTWDRAAQRIGADYFNKVRASIDRTLASM
ncbi:hypothetical protein AGMMS50293_03630 [Spirochaetia bacterium]|nr:hypothetical protein AGMMS50293_03630 [Spirochaetia bacterium]